MALLGVVLAITAVRISLIGKGTMAFVDEQRYVTAMLGLRALGEGHGLEFLRAINSMGARPGDGLWRAIPGLGQAVLLLATGLNPNSPPSLQVPQLFNVLIMSLNMLLLYKIYRQFFRASMALLGMVLYSSLINTNLYLRHLLPYDHALFFFLLALWLLLRLAARPAGWKYGLVGALAAFSYAVYPGYFMGPAVLLALGIVLALASPVDGSYGPSVGRLVPVGWQLAGLLVVLGGLQLVSRLADTSYLASSRYISTTVTQGSFDEGLSFIGSYYWQVEGGLGLGLLLLFGIGLLVSLRAIGQRQGRYTTLPLAALLSIAFLAWLGYAGAVLAHKLVFYGRILHFFGPFVVLGALVALNAGAQAWPKGSKLVLTLAWGLAVWHFGAFARTYQAIDYPCDVAYHYGIHNQNQIAANETSVCDKNIVFYRLFGPRLRPGQPMLLETARYQLLNFAYLYPITCYKTPERQAGTVVASVPYFMKYRAYQFEGHNQAQRTILQVNEVDFRIVKRD
ncbi:hypothetical protein GCM10022407_35530 [Hymenobacter antarcticus]|uniref:Glycosyltransferase RgtA/B/C/D-like domain-containing protein n=1 Tax=Hymenobacter antarcticus TaxID=486270 RepID=A0ABP7QU22_9BACT